MVYKIAITGIDGAGKSSIVEKVVDILASKYRICVTGRPGDFRYKDTKISEYETISEKIRMLHEFADNTKNRLLVAGANFVNVGFVGFVERNMIKKYNPDLVIIQRSMIIDPSVYLSYYLPRISQNMSIEEKLYYSKIISGVDYRDLLFLLTVSPNIAVQRIKKRNIEKNRRWQHIHENEESLEILSNSFYEVLRVANLREGLNVIEIDTEQRTKEGTIEIVTEEIINFRDKGIKYKWKKY